MFVLNILVVLFISAKMRQAFVAIQEQSTQGFEKIEVLKDLIYKPNDAEQTSNNQFDINKFREAGLFLLLVNTCIYVASLPLGRHDTPRLRICSKTI